MGIKRIFDIQGFEGGESDDLYKGPANSFYAGENIEIRKLLNGFSLSPKLVEQWVFISEIVYMDVTSNLGVAGAEKVICCLENGEIYLDGVLKHTLTGSNAEKRVSAIGSNYVPGDIKQYLYFFSQSNGGKVHRATTDLVNWNDNHLTFSATGLSNATKGFTITSGGVLYFAISDSVFNITNTEVLSKDLTINRNEEIVGFTQFQGNYKIYANNSGSGIQYIWNGADDFIDYRQEWRTQPILGITNDGAYDYAVLGYISGSADLYLISGTQKQEIRTSLEGSNYGRILTGGLSVRQGIVFLSGGASGESNNNGIYTYGNYYPGTAKSLVASYIPGSYSFQQHCHTVANSYFASFTKVYKVNHSIPPFDGYIDSGYIITHMYQGISWERKNLIRVKIGFKSIGGTVKVYARTSFTNTFTLLKYFTDTSKNFGDIAGTEIIQAGLGTFNEIQFKIELLKGTGNQDITVTRFTAEMEVVDNF